MGVYLKERLYGDLIKDIFTYVLIFLCFIFFTQMLTGCSRVQNNDILNDELQRSIEKMQQNIEQLKKDLLYCSMESEKQKWCDETYEESIDMHKEAVCENVTDTQIVFSGKEFNNDIIGNEDFTGLFTLGQTYE